MDWYFPTELKEVPPLLEKEGIVVHGGGTGLLRTGLKQLKGLVDLSGLPLDTVGETGGEITFGSCNTYSSVCKILQEKDPGSILLKALSQAASTPLRNRITLGGSIASFPIWSDLMGPLIALDSEITLQNGTETKYPIEKIVTDRNILKGKLITGIKYKKEWPLSWYHRQTRVAFDYPLFTLSILLDTDGNIIRNSRIMVVGTRSRYQRLYELEQEMNGQETDSLDHGTLLKKLPELDFPEREISTSDQLNHLLRVWFRRGMTEITRGRK